MDPVAEQQMIAESTNWLYRGRARMLSNVLNGVLRDRDGLRLLEVGAGVGQNLTALARYGTVDAVEVSPAFLPALRANPIVSQVYSEGLPSLELDTRYDVIVALDVLEHIERDDLAVDWIAEHLNPGGVFIAAVPAYQVLFSDHDRAIYHYRRYSRPQLERLLQTRLTVVWSSYFNTVLFPAAVASRMLWQAKRRLLEPNAAPAKQSSSGGGLVSKVGSRVIALEADRLGRARRAPFGLTAVAVARRQ